MYSPRKVREALACEEEAHALVLGHEVGVRDFTRRVYRRHRGWEGCFGAWQSHLAAEHDWGYVSSLQKIHDIVC